MQTVKGIVKASKQSDEKAIEDGELLKYVVEIYDKKNILNEVKEFYSKVYAFHAEISRDMNLLSINHKIRGPFPLVEDALTNSKLDRWEIEREKCDSDKNIIDMHLSKNREYKYGYIVYDEIFTVKRFVELKFTNVALPKYKIDKMLKSSDSSHKRCIIRVKLDTKKEKIYQ